MANVDHDAILTTVREVIDDGNGSVRTVTSGRFNGGAYAGQPPGSETLYALATPTFRTAITGQRRHPASPPILGSFTLYEIDVEVEVIRGLQLRHKVNDDIRDDAKALAANDADVLAQALTYPGNMTGTSASALTGLVSGVLQYEGSSGTIELADDTNGRIVSTHTFSGVVHVTLATS